MKKYLAALLLCCINFSASSAVILQYHHVSDNTPASTSITPTQFEAHLKYLSDNNFTVVPLSEIINSVKKKQPLLDKRIAITFDDAYIDILTNGKPILDKYNYPYTIFINANVTKSNPKTFLSWKQLKALADDGVIIANHGFEHDSMTRPKDGLTSEQWLKKYTGLLLKSEKLIKQHTGQSWRYFAYPYGEYSPKIQKWMKDNDFVAFSQQSGAVGLNSDLTAVPRFPASKPYDEISSLRDKINSLPFNISLNEEQNETIFPYKAVTSITFNIEVDDFYKSQLNCYISGAGKQKIEWEGDDQFTINFSKPLQPGRVRCNCTAASISKPGRYYWYSKPWFVLKPDGSWYHL